MTNIILFSKDRASQCDLFLRSIKEFFKEYNTHNIKILYTYSNDNFKRGYDKLIEKSDNNIKFIKETNFKQDLNNILDKTSRYTIFFVDDNVFKEYFSFNDDIFKHFDSNKSEILCLSLRLNNQLNWCYPSNSPMKKPRILHSKYNIIDFRYETGDYSYPLSLDGHIFSTKDILQYIEKLSYNNPNSLESNLAAFTNNMKKRYVIYYDKSIIMNLPINKVQNFNNNFHGNISADYLNDNYLNDKNISLDNIRHFDNISCHQEIEINLI